MDLGRASRRSGKELKQDIKRNGKGPFQRASPLPIANARANRIKSRTRTAMPGFGI